MKILCVHQGYELYGSDRCFVASVRALRRRFTEAQIHCIIPADGPLVALLRPVSDSVLIQPLWVVRRRHLFRLVASGWLSLPMAIARAVRQMRESDLIYINTIVILDYLITARFFRSKALLHVHEIPVNKGGRLLRFLVRSAKVRTIFNSVSTRRTFEPCPGGHWHVLYNGFDGPTAYKLPSYSCDRRLKVLLMGRLSSWKGQDVLIEACGRVSPEIRSLLDVRIVGSTFDSDVLLESRLHRLVEQWNCSSCVTFEPFSEHPKAWYEWCDLAIVPSTRPEPLGRIPIEAMSFGRGSIVSAIGGLTETVEDGQTGWHVPPNDAAALAAALTRAIKEPQWIEHFGRKGRERYEKLFRQEIIDSKFDEIVQALVRHGAGAPAT